MMFELGMFVPELGRVIHTARLFALNPLWTFRTGVGVARPRLGNPIHETSVILAIERCVLNLWLLGLFLSGSNPFSLPQNKRRKLVFSQCLFFRRWSLMISFLVMLEILWTWRTQ